MAQGNAIPRDAATNTSPAPLAEGDVPEQDGSEDPQVGLQFMRDAGALPEKGKANDVGISPQDTPPSPAAMEPDNQRSDVRDAGAGEQTRDEIAQNQDSGSQQMLSFRVEDAHCQHCADAITKAVRAADPAAGVEVNLDEHVVRVTSALAGDDIAAAIREAGYTPASVPPTGSSTSFMN